jgi:hypothetical protein
MAVWYSLWTFGLIKYNLANLVCFTEDEIFRDLGPLRERRPPLAEAEPVPPDPEPETRLGRRTGASGPGLEPILQTTSEFTSTYNASIEVAYVGRFSK